MSEESPHEKHDDLADAPEAAQAEQEHVPAANSAESESPWLNWALGPGMYYLGVTFLLLLASVMVLWIDVPRVIESGEMLEEGFELPELSAEELAFEETAYNWGKFAGIVLLIIWPVFIAEHIYHLLRLASFRRFHTEHPFWWGICLIPPLRIAARRRSSELSLNGALSEEGSAGQASAGESRSAGSTLGLENPLGQGAVWLPGYGWKNVNRELRRELERAFSIPIIWIALMILPVLGLQFYFKEHIADYPSLRIALHFGTGLIWFAFTFEFIVMVSVAESKIAYCKRHWLDLVIILLPLISFLRTLRLLRASKLVKVGRLQQLTKVVRAYRLRGVAMRGLRALLLLEVLNRLLRIKPENQLKKLEKRFAEKQRELTELQHEIDDVKAIIARRKLEEEEREQSLHDATTDPADDDSVEVAK